MSDRDIALLKEIEIIVGNDKKIAEEIGLIRASMKNIDDYIIDRTLAFNRMVKEIYKDDTNFPDGDD